VPRQPEKTLKPDWPRTGGPLNGFPSDICWYEVRSFSGVMEEIVRSRFCPMSVGFVPTLKQISLGARDAGSRPAPPYGNDFDLAADHKQRRAA